MNEIDTLTDEIREVKALVRRHRILGNAEEYAEYARRLADLRDERVQRRLTTMRSASSTGSEQP